METAYSVFCNFVKGYFVRRIDSTGRIERLPARQTFFHGNFFWTTLYTVCNFVDPSPSGIPWAVQPLPPPSAGTRKHCMKITKHYEELDLRHKVAHLFSGKSTKTAATRAALFDFSMHQIVCRLGLRPGPIGGGANSAPPDLLAGFEGPYF